MDLARFQTFCTDTEGLPDAMQYGADFLKVGEETALCNARDLFPDATLFLGHPSPGDHPSGDRSFSANLTSLRHLFYPHVIINEDDNVAKVYHI